jgi:hypothetical protein
MRSPEEAREALQDLIPGWVKLSVSDDMTEPTRIYQVIVHAYGTSALPEFAINDESEEAMVTAALWRLRVALDDLGALLEEHLDA